MVRMFRSMRVSESFARYIESIRNNTRKETGRELSSAEITSILSSIQPQIRIESKKKRRSSIFDF